MNRQSSLESRIFLAFALTGCGHPTETPFNQAPTSIFGGLDPTVPTIPPDQEENPENNPNEPELPQPKPLPSSEFCKPDSNQQYPSQPIIDFGQREAVVWAKGGSCLHQSLIDVWTTLQEPSKIQWDGVDEIKVQILKPEGPVHLHTRVEYIVNAFIRVSWTMDWFHSVIAGTLQDPRSVLIRFARIRGSSHVAHWQGSIVLHSLGPNLTGFAMAHEIRASRTGPENARGAILDILRKVGTNQNGLEPEPIPPTLRFD